MRFLGLRMDLVEGGGTESTLRNSTTTFSPPFDSRVSKLSHSYGIEQFIFNVTL
jgi:hypothetical protein